MHARGIEHSSHGVDNCLACINLALARGQVGKPGSGTMMITGQGNGQGGREVGQKANQDLAARLGRGRYFPYRSTRQVWDELRLASKGGMSDYYGITWEKIDAQGGVFWPCPTEDHPGTPRLFTERFGHADGRARFLAMSYTPPAEEPGGEFPFRLTTGGVVYHYLSGTQTRRLEFLNSQAPEPWVETQAWASSWASTEVQNSSAVVAPSHQYAAGAKSGYSRGKKPVASDQVIRPAIRNQVQSR